MLLGSSIGEGGTPKSFRSAIFIGVILSFARGGRPVREGELIALDLAAADGVPLVAVGVLESEEGDRGRVKPSFGIDTVRVIELVSAVTSDSWFEDSLLSAKCAIELGAASVVTSSSASIISVSLDDDEAS